METNYTQTGNPQKAADIKPRIIYITLGVFTAAFLMLIIFSIVKYNSKLITLNPLGKEGGDTIVPNIKNIQHPITGIMYSQEEAAGWENLRPLAVMVNNHVDARPQSGLINADIVYEMVAEGGITRYLAFYLSQTPEKIGPVRSTREYYLVLVKELGDAMLMHIGWSPQALQAIEQWPVRSLGRGGGSFWRDNPNDVAIEHTAYVDGVDLRKTADALGWQGKKDFSTWKFNDDSQKYAAHKTAENVSIDFWYKGDYSPGWKYDVQTNSYLRFLGYDTAQNPIPDTDRESGKQILVKNLIVQFVIESSIAGDDKNRLTYELVGSGNALIFLDGKVINATWSKSARDERTMYYDLNGREIEFNRGNFWISIVPDRNIDQVVF